MAKNKSFVKIGIIYAIGQVLSKALSFILLPIYTRQLGTIGYGQLALADTVLDFIGAFVICGVYSGYYRFYREYDENQRRKLKNTAINFALALVALDIILVLIIGRPIAKLIFNFNDPYKILILVVMRSILVQFVTLLMCDYTLNYKAGITVITNLANLILNMGFSILFVVYLKQGIIGVYNGYIFSNLIILIYLIFINIKSYRLEFDKSMLKNMLTFSGGLISCNLAGTVLTLSDRYFLAGYRNYSETGVYSMGYKFGMLIDPLFISPFKDIFTPYKFQVWKDDDAEEKFNKMFNKYHLLGLFILLGISIYSRFIISIFTTKEFINAYKIVPLILFSYFIYGENEFYTLGIQIRNKTYLTSIIMILGGIFNIILNISLIPSYGMYGAAVATLISYIVINLINMIYSNRLFNVKYNLKNSFKLYFITFLLYLFYYILSVFNKNIIIELIYNILILTMYVLICLIFNIINKKQINDYKNKTLNLFIYLGVAMRKWGQMIGVILLIFSLAIVIIYGEYNDNKVSKQILLDNQKLIENTKNKQASSAAASSSSGSIYDKISKKQSISILVLGDAQASSDGATQDDKWTTKVKLWLTSEYGVNVDLKILAIPHQNAFGALASYQKLGANTYDFTLICLGENDITDLNLNAFQTAYEELIRVIKASRASTDIMTIVESSIQQNTTYPKAILDISSHYNLLSVDMRAEFKKSSIPYNNLSTDTILPNKDGYNIYTSAVENALKNAIASKRNVKFEDNGILNAAAKNYAALKTISEINKNEGFTQNSDGFSSSTIGHSLSYKFTGNLVGASLKFGKSSGKLKISIDDKLVKEIDCYSPSEAKSALLISDALTQGEHTIKFTISNIKNGSSSGTEANIYNIITN